MRTQIKSLFAIAAIGLFGVGAVSAHHISGSVICTDATPPIPLAGVQVTIQGSLNHYQAVTGADGTFYVDLARVTDTYTVTIVTPPGLAIISPSGGQYLVPIISGSDYYLKIFEDAHFQLTGCVQPFSPGTGTPGYWKNHPEAWPVDSITIGGVVYTTDQAIQIMKLSVAGDKWRTMFNALVCARLNVIIGNASSCIVTTIGEADDWMETYSSPVKANSNAWRLGEPLYLRLDDYNNGRLCAPHRN